MLAVWKVISFESVCCLVVRCGCHHFLIVESSVMRLMWSSYLMILNLYYIFSCEDVTFSWVNSLFDPHRRWCYIFFVLTPMWSSWLLMWNSFYILSCEDIVFSWLNGRCDPLSWWYWILDWCDPLCRWYGTFTESSVVKLLCSAESVVYVILTGDDVMVAFSWCVYVRCFYIIYFCEDIVGI